jgi:hypothetical protein
VISGIVVGFRGFLLYNTVNKAGANSSRVAREPLLAEAMAARRRDTMGVAKRLGLLGSPYLGGLSTFIQHNSPCAEGLSTAITLFSGISSCFNRSLLYSTGRQAER